MVRVGVIASALVLIAAAASAQTSSELTGFATVQLGVVSGGDVRDKGWTPGASVSVIDASGLGAEIDLSHARKFDDDRFRESGITSLMLNVIGVRSPSFGMYRPYGGGGVGLLRVRACIADCQLVVSRTDWAFNGGGGLMVFFNDIVGVRGDVRYYRFFERHEDLPLTDNGFFDFWRTSVGVTVSWPIR